MKIAVTADLHLSSRKKNPERFHALEAILQIMLLEKIHHLAILGDVFDADQKSYSEFEKLCRDTKFKEIQFLLLPGNHDPELTQRGMTAENVQVFEQPEIFNVDILGLPILFLPYINGKNMGEAIAPFMPELEPQSWILFGHGDWIQGMREINPYESGVYMPLTRMDVERTQPKTVILGHIHKPTDESILHYPGSPCPLHINETGKRWFLILDADTGAVTPHPLDSDILYFQVNLTILPLDDEKTYLVKQIQSVLKEWNLSEEEKKKSQIRIQVKGYTKDKSALLEIVEQGFSGFQFYGDKPDLEEVSLSNDIELAEIAQQVTEVVKTQTLLNEPNQPQKDQVLLEALKTIYGD